MMMVPTGHPFTRLAFEQWRLWNEASIVVWLCMFRLMQGGPLAEREAKRMVIEKVWANATLGWAIWPEMFAAKPAEKVAKRVTSHYRKRVSANRRRLTR